MVTPQMAGDAAAALRNSLPQGVKLVAVSKFHPVDMLMGAYQKGQRKFGESRVQELLPKIQAMPHDVQWHFIGHLQRNKVSQIVGRVALIESVDSERLLQAIDDAAVKNGTTARILMQVHVAAEETKFGFSPDELLDFFRQGKYQQLKATHICGLMGMATNTDDAWRIEQDFALLNTLQQTVARECCDLRGFDTLSMGMSDDYPLAIKHGSNLVRVGTKIFGERQY